MRLTGTASPDMTSMVASPNRLKVKYDNMICAIHTLQRQISLSASSKFCDSKVHKVTKVISITGKTQTCKVDKYLVLNCQLTSFYQSRNQNQLVGDKRWRNYPLLSAKQNNESP